MEGYIFGARSDVPLAHDCRQTIEMNRDSCVENEMGNEQPEAGNIAAREHAGETRRVRLIGQNEDNRGSDVLTETCERSVAG